jgi:tubby-related protein 1
MEREIRQPTTVADPASGIKDTLIKCRENKAMFIATLCQLKGAHESIRMLVTTPLSREMGVIELEITRNAAGFNTFTPKYILSLVSTDSRGDEIKQQLMVAKKKLVNRTSNYVLSLDIKNPRSKGSAFMGKLRASNSKKNEYFLFGPGENPEKVKAGQKARKTFMLAKFSDDFIEGFGKVKKTQVLMPRFDERYVDDPFSYDGIDDPHELAISKNVHALKNKKPRWSKSKKQYVFKFGTRVKEPSNKNTQLIEEFRYDPETTDTEENNQESLKKENIVFQFGKFDKITFNLDIQAPFSIFQAFGL